MNTRELIAELQQQDPSGEVTVCVGNSPIFFVERLPAYYDGPLLDLTRDPTKKPNYDVIAVKYRRSGDKVKLHTLDVEDAIEMDPNVPVDVSELSERQRETELVAIEMFRAKWRQYWDGRK